MSQQDNSCGDDEAEIEQPRLEDSRASLMQLPQLEQLPPYDLLLMLPNCRKTRSRDPTALLSSTLMHESGLEQDWPTASSIGLANSRDSGQPSDKLNDAKLGLGISASTADDAANGSSSASESAVAVADSDDDDDDEIPSIRDEADGHQQGLSGNPSSASSPRLRILAKDDCEDQIPPPAAPAGLPAASGLQQAPSDPLQAPHQPPQRMLGLLQVCCLTLDVLSEGGLLCDDARRWLTPELLCDKLCDRLARPPRPSAPPPASCTASSYESVASESSSLSSAVLDVEAADTAAACGSGRDSPTNRVRRWLKAVAASPTLQPNTKANYSV